MIEGIINCFKHEGITSFGVVNYLKKHLHVKKAGHSGTLDPMATGVLPVFTGRATRLIEYQHDLPKIYRAEMILGQRTDTQDRTGTVLERKETGIIKKEEILSLFEKFTGPIEQIPPMYSAVKYHGKKLYELARKGIEIDRQPRKVVIYGITLIEPYFDSDPLVSFEVECSSGTYIRTLCDSMGYVLGCGACLNSLVRISTGSFHISSSYKLDEIEEYYVRGHIDKILLPFDYSVRHLPSVKVLPEFEADLLNGKRLNLNQIEGHNLLPSQKICIYNYDKLLLAISELQEDMSLKPLKVFNRL
ncbi:MAG: tRNA pseudouridine(55) synthase TruB [Candidatus Eremiobacterota bacterium]